MAILNNNTVTIDAVLTAKGRELLARNDGSFRIKKETATALPKVEKAMLPKLEKRSK